MRALTTLYLGVLIIVLLSFHQESGWAAPQEADFNFTGGQQSFVVPPGVTSIHIQAWGAQGATVFLVPAGLGGFAEGDLNVTPGQSLQIFVGGQGCVETNFIPGCGGFNGGGDAQALGGAGRGGGGGASDVRVDGATLNDRVIVAAGGGGACSLVEFPGGNGGGLEGSPGGTNEPGGGGTQNSGGAGYSNPEGCTNGGFGFGGSNTAHTTCAGGGGGWYGGGGGCGGGGGSSYIDGVANGNTESGVREGDGLVILTFNTIAPIPTLSEWGLISMAGILGIAGFLAIRRRKATA